MNTQPCLPGGLRDKVRAKESSRNAWEHRTYESAHAVNIWLSDVRTFRQSMRPGGQKGTCGGLAHCVGGAQANRAYRRQQQTPHQRISRRLAVVELREDRPHHRLRRRPRQHRKVWAI